MKRYKQEVPKRVLEYMFDCLPDNYKLRLIKNYVFKCSQKSMIHSYFLKNFFVVLYKCNTNMLAKPVPVRLGS
jgi:hypothetical protein